MENLNKKIIIKNRKASFNYEFIEELIVGICLVGSEVKSIRASKASIGEAHCYIQSGEVFITGMHIAEYKESGRSNHEPYRKRKLLLTNKQIKNWDDKLKTKGNTIVPIKLFTNDKGLIKLNIALAKGKKNYEKRNKILQKQVDRETIEKINSLN